MKTYRAIPEFYDAEYEQLEMLQRDVPFFLSKIPKRSQQVLEVAVGTARAAIPIAQAGHHVAGIDNDPAVLQIARRKRDSVGLGDRQLKLHRADARKFRLNRRFDICCIFFNTFLSFATLADQDRVLQSIRRHLRPGGRLWLDVFLPDPAWLSDNRSALDPKLFYVPHLGFTVQREVELRPDRATQIQHVRFRYRWFDAHGSQRSRYSEFDLTFLFPREMRILLERNGFEIREIWGDYDGSPLTQKSPRMIVLASLDPSPSGRGLG